MKETPMCYKKHYAQRENHHPNNEIPDRLDAYDWEQAFYYVDNYNREDVKKVIHADEGANEEADWIGLFLMNDGKYVGLSAGCDYTGWD